MQKRVENNERYSKTHQKGGLHMGKNAVKILLDKIKRHCAPFCCASVDIYGTAGYHSKYRRKTLVVNKGTLTFVEFQGKHFAITHLDLYLTPRIEGKSLEVSLRGHELWDFNLFSEPFRGIQDCCHSLIFLPLLNDDVGKLKATKAAPLMLPQEVPKINKGDMVLASGFSMDGRKRIPDRSRFSHVLGTIDLMSEETFWVSDLDPERTMKIPFVGIRGGPIFKVDENSGTYTLIGIIEKMHGFKGQRPAQCDSDRNICIVGQTVNGMHIERLMDENEKSNNESKEVLK